MTDAELADRIGAWAFGRPIDMIREWWRRQEAMFTPAQLPPHTVTCPVAHGYVAPPGVNHDRAVYQWLARDGALPFSEDWWVARMEASRRWETEGDGMGGNYGRTITPRDVVQRSRYRGRSTRGHR